MRKDEVRMSVGCLMLVIIEGIGEILKHCVDRIMVEMITGVTFRIAVREISGSREEIGFKTMIADLTIGDINLEIEVITAQGAKCRNIGVVELNTRIREFEKPWLFHVLADLEYPCVLGIDFIGGLKIILDFDRKSLAIPDSQINKVVKTVAIEKVEIDLSKTKLEDKQKRELQDLFDSFQGLFSD
ncbi:uncharacterized protein TNCV_846831 [Trichonephila clavipes]|nr:uncharacterized protein TNCV_846831 [Trichonephila clavipes]